MTLNRSQTEKVDPGFINSNVAAAGTPLVADGTGGAVFDATGDIPPAAILLAEGAVMVGDASGQATALSAKGDGKVLVGNGTTITSVSVSGDITITNAGVAAIGAAKVTQAMVVPNSLDGTVAKNVAESAVIGGLPVVFMIPIVAGALGNTDITVTNKIRVIDAYLILRGAGVSSTTLQVKNGTSAITNAMAASGSDQAVVRAATIDDAAYEIAAAGTLRVTSATGATQPAALVVVTAVRVA